MYWPIILKWFQIKSQITCKTWNQIQSNPQIFLKIWFKSNQISNLFWDLIGPNLNWDLIKSCKKRPILGESKHFLSCLVYFHEKNYFFSSLFWILASKTCSCFKMGGQNFKNPIISKVNFLKTRYFAIIFRKRFDLKFRTFRIWFSNQISNLFSRLEIKSNPDFGIWFEIWFDFKSNRQYTEFERDNNSFASSICIKTAYKNKDWPISTGFTSKWVYRVTTIGEFEYLFSTFDCFQKEI